MTILMVGLLCVGLLAYANGANDNFKGVATLFGSGVSDYKKALNWGTAMTFAGSVAAVWLAASLVATFSGKQIVSPDTLALPGFATAVVMAAAATVLIATRIGAPISTTHALVGALLGAGFAAPESAINWSKVSASIFLPLAIGPLLAIASAMLLYPLLTRLRSALGITRETCVCVGNEWVPQTNGTALGKISVVIENQQVCQERYSGAMFGVSAQTLLDRLHYLSAGLVSFARGVNDTPKIVALMLLAAPLTGQGMGAFIGVGVVIALGGLLGAQRVAQTMSKKITAMNPGQGLTANLITSALVMVASPLGLPLSTTHVSCGALFGIGAVTRQARWKTIAGIFAAWLVTLPLAATLGAMLMRLSFLT
ncbi:MAG: inorganic phosphate transporter [Pseudomonadota bacterium]